MPLMTLQQLGYKRIFDAVTSRVLSAFELTGVRRGLKYLGTGSGYVAIQSTRPATLGYALYGNPVGIASWILEVRVCFSVKLCSSLAYIKETSLQCTEIPRVDRPTEPSFRTARRKAADQVHGRNDAVRQLLFSYSPSKDSIEAFSELSNSVNLSIYYLTSTIHTSFMLYNTNIEDWRGDMSVFNPAIKKPYGRKYLRILCLSAICIASQPPLRLPDSAYVHEIARPPKAWLPGHNVNLVWHKEKPFGGHFAGW